MKLIGELPLWLVSRTSMTIISPDCQWGHYPYVISNQTYHNICTYVCIYVLKTSILYISLVFHIQRICDHKLQNRTNFGLVFASSEFCPYCLKVVLFSCGAYFSRETHHSLPSKTSTEYKGHNYMVIRRNLPLGSLLFCTKSGKASLMFNIACTFVS